MELSPVEKVMFVADELTRAERLMREATEAMANAINTIEEIEEEPFNRVAHLKAIRTPAVSSLSSLAASARFWNARVLEENAK